MAQLAVRGVNTRFIVTILCACLPACGSVPKAPLQLDLEAKTFTAPAGSARIYVYRLGKSWFGRYDSRIRINRASADASSNVGAIAKKLYRFVDVSPGLHTITAVTVLYDEGYPKEIAKNSLAVDVVEGSSYFVRVEVPGISPGDPPEMRLVGAAEGMAAVRSCQLAGS